MMKPLLIAFYLFVLMSCFLYPKQSFTQNDISQSVLGNGGKQTSNETNIIVGTLGQSVIGMSYNSSHRINSGFWHGIIDKMVAVEQIQSDVLPKHFRLEQNYPNPFNPTTTIRFALPKPAKVTLSLFDVLGREIALLVDDNFQPGEHKLVFDASGLKSGLYVYRIQAENYKSTKKLMLIK